MGFSRGLAAEVGRSGVTVNCISLGSDDARRMAELLEQDPEVERKHAARRTRWAGSAGSTTPRPSPSCSAATPAEWITGQVYPVDGGYAPAL